MRSIRIGVVPLLFILSTSVRAAEAAARPPAPPSLLAQFDYFLGSWQCDGWDAASVLGPAHATRTELVFERELDGRWIAMHWNEQATEENPYPWRLENSFEYDSVKGQFVYVSRDNTGVLALGESRGWDGDTLTITGAYSYAAQQMPYRDIYVKHGEGKFELVTETRDGEKWSKDADLRCRKTH